MTAYVVLDGSGNIVGMFANPQDPAQIAGYAELPDSDSRIAAFEAAAAAKLAAIVNPPPLLNFQQFVALFTAAEQAALLNSTDTQARLFVLFAANATAIQLNSQEVIQGVNYVAALGIITSARAQQILAGKAPS